jgi:hypothetical protein
LRCERNLDIVMDRIDWWKIWKCPGWNKKGCWGLLSIEGRRREGRMGGMAVLSIQEGSQLSND